MSGLAALWHRDGRPVAGATLDAMLAAVAYRGPDGRRLWLDGPVGLGHAGMATTPEALGERQPLVSPRTGCVLGADLRLDNRDDLLATLPERPPAGASDADLLLRAYDAWGVDAVARLLGDFAFVLWDPRRQRLLCARDGAGQRALFYRVDARAFAAASEIHQLLQDPAVPVEPDDEAIRDSLTPFAMARNEQDQAATFYAGIAALPAGHLLLVEREDVRLRQYWKLEPPAEVRYRTADQYAEHFRALFGEVVRARLRSAGPIGALLSGGLDSSSLVCVAHELYRAGQAEDRGFTSFSFVFDGLDCDERPLIAEVGAKYGFAMRYLPSARTAECLELAPRGFRESPNMGVSAQRDAVCGAAEAAGIRVLLTGDWADNCVGGSALAFDSLLRHGRPRAALAYLRAYRRQAGESLRATLALYGLLPLLPLDLHARLMWRYLRRAIRRHGHRLLPPWMPAPCREELLRRHLRLAEARERGRRFGSPAREAEYRLLSPPEIARHPAPWSVELWRPFADRRLHEFLLAIPPEEKYAPHPASDDYYAGAKQVVRRALRGVLPESIRTRTTKTVFGAVFADEVDRHWPRYEAAFGPGARPLIAARGYVDPALFWLRLRALRSGTYAGDFHYVTRMVALESWLRGFALPRSELVTVARPPGRQPDAAPVHGPDPAPLVPA